MKKIDKDIFLVDSHYLDQEGHTACYLIVAQDQAAIIETNTNHAVPLILASLKEKNIKPEQVRYVVVTHVHLDHAGGVGKLMQELPRAQLVVHQRGAPHLIQPEKLVASVKDVYGDEQYRRMYGEVVPVAQERIIAFAEPMTMQLADHKLQIFAAPGHARHHLIVYDKTSRTLFSGDAFGIGYPRFHYGAEQLIFPSTSPTQFDPALSRQTIDAIAHIRPRMVLLTHFGAVVDITKACRQLNEWLEFSVSTVQKWYNQGCRAESLQLKMEDEFWQAYEKKLQTMRPGPLSETDRQRLQLDVHLNAQGLIFWQQQQSS